MNKNSVAIRTTVQLALLTAIEIIFAFTVLGSIPIGPLVATLSHIPVLIAAICLGPKPGAYMGFVFGTMSMIWFTMYPGPVSFIFTPFVTVGNINGGLYSVLICFIPRILLGVMGSYLYRWFSGRVRRGYLAAAASAVIATLLHTVLVLGGVYLFFGVQYAAAIGQSYELLLGLIGTTVLTNGVPEAIIAGVVLAALVRPLRRFTYGNV